METDCHCHSTPISPPIGPTLAEVCGGNPLILFLQILHTFLISQCDILDPCRQPANIETPLAEYDFIVVGAGAAGSVVASRLSANPRHRVLLIEAGGPEPTDLQVPAVLMAYQRSAAVDWGYFNEPNGHAFLGQPGQRAEWPRGKMMGGSSSVHGMVYLRGNPADYDEWQQLGNPGWSYADVLPHFERLDRELFRRNEQDTERPEPKPLTRDLLEASAGAGLPPTDLNGASPDGAMIGKFFIQHGTRLSAAKAYLRPHSKRPNLHIMQHTMVTKVLLDRETNRAYAVRALRGNATVPIEIRASKEVIICAGAEQSPKLLMLSGIGSRPELDRWGIEQRVNRPGVGQNLQNHVAVHVIWETDMLPAVRMNWAVATEYLLQRTGLLAIEGGTTLELKYASRLAENPDSPDVQIEFYDSLHLAGNVCDSSADQRENGAKFTLFSVSVALKPQSVGHIGLRSADPLALPRIVGNELSAARDVEVLLDGVHRIFAIMQQEVLGKYNFTIRRRGSGVAGRACGHFDTGADAYWRCMIRYDTVQYLHPAGTCRMGAADDAQAVVDHQLKVHGAKSLRVVDASVMPKVVAGNTCATTMMIGEKASVMIANTWE